MLLGTSVGSLGASAGNNLTDMIKRDPSDEEKLGLHGPVFLEKRIVWHKWSY